MIDSQSDSFVESGIQSSEFDSHFNDLWDVHDSPVLSTIYTNSVTDENRRELVNFKIKLEIPGPLILRGRKLTISMSEMPPGFPALTMTSPQQQRPIIEELAMYPLKETWAIFRFPGELPYEVWPDKKRVHWSRTIRGESLRRRAFRYRITCAGFCMQFLTQELAYVLNDLLFCKECMQTISHIDIHHLIPKNTEPCDNVETSAIDALYLLSMRPFPSLPPICDSIN